MQPSLLNISPPLTCKVVPYIYYIFQVTQTKTRTVNWEKVFVIIWWNSHSATFPTPPPLRQLLHPGSATLPSPPRWWASTRTGSPGAQSYSIKLLFLWMKIFCRYSQRCLSELRSFPSLKDSYPEQDRRWRLVSCRPHSSHFHNFAAYSSLFFWFILTCWVMDVLNLNLVLAWSKL